MRGTDVRPMLAALVAGWTATAGAQIPLRVSIDVKPGDPVTTIEADRGGMLPVAFMSTAQFDASTVDPSTIRLGPTGTEAEPFRTSVEDVDRDGRSDMIILVRMPQLNVTCDDKEIRLTGKTNTGLDIEGSEAVTVEGCVPDAAVAPHTPRRRTAPEA